MPSIQKQQYKYQGKCVNTFLLLLCSSILAACGDGTDTTRVFPPEETIKPPPTISYFNITATMPMQMVNASMTIKVVGQDEPLYHNTNFSGFNATVNDLVFADYKNKIMVAEISGNDQTLMYDPILNRMVPFKGKMHVIKQINSGNNKLLITPASEATYQRAITRSSQFDFTAPDLSLITNEHIQKANSEVTTSLHSAFSGIDGFMPTFNNLHSISVVKMGTSVNSYRNLFLGLGLMQHFKNIFPNTQNTYLEVSQSIGIDLRDGHFDGRSIAGDLTPFTAIVSAPYNTNPLNNAFNKIGEQQKTVREDFGQALKAATLYYANEVAFQDTLNPLGIKEIEKFSDYTVKNPSTSTTLLKWRGAGDYRPAFGISTTESCNNSSNACRQGLNADDLKTYVNDVEYLIGTHQLNQCTIQFFPSGDVSLTKADTIYRSGINRDLSDNLQQLNNDLTHYILNVGASENKPAYFLQFEIKDMQIIQARTGYNTDIYSTSIETPEIDCTN